VNHIRVLLFYRILIICQYKQFKIHQIHQRVVKKFVASLKSNHIIQNNLNIFNKTSSSKHPSKTPSKLYPQNKTKNFLYGNNKNVIYKCISHDWKPRKNGNSYA